MTTLIRFSRAFVVAASGIMVAGGASAQASWDIDACIGGTKLASGYTNCGGTGTTLGATLTVKAYTTTAAGSNFSSTSINSQSGYIGVLSGAETAGTASPNHAIDNYTSLGNSYELVHLQFSKAVDLSQLAAVWSNDQSGGDADFQLYRWNYDAATPNPTITSFKPNAMTGWALAASGDFDISPGLTQTVSDGNYYSSHWLVATAFGGSNDAFKLGSVNANVCAQSQTSTGGCGSIPGGNPTPEPTSLALLGMAAFGAAAARRRQQGKRA